MPEIQTFRDPVSIWDHIDVAMVRDPKGYTYESHDVYGGPEDGTERDRLQKIQLGAGFKHLEGWRNLEYPDWDADKPIPAKGFTAHDYCSPSSFSIMVDDKAAQPNESVSEIASYHTLDHLSPAQVVRTLREVERVLEPGGTFTNILPHADSQLAKECIWHSSRFMIDTWRNIFSERQYVHDGEWKLEVGLNFIFGLTERNTVLVTQLIKK